MDSLKNDISLISAQLRQIVDGGNTAQLNNTVLSSTANESYELRNELLSKSPYLSDSVMVTSVQAESILPSLFLKDVLVANPQSAKSDTILKSIDARISPIPSNMMEDILDGRYLLSPKEIMEASISTKASIRNKLFCEVIQYYTHDSLHASNDSVLYIFQNEDNINGEYLLASWYSRNNQYQTAENIIDSIPVKNNFSDYEQDEYLLYKQLFDINKDLIEEEKTYNELDSIQYLTLCSIATDTKHRAGCFARNILISIDSLDYHEAVLYPTFTENYKSYCPKTKPLKEKNKLEINPNPAAKYFIVEYDNDKIVPGFSSIYLYDAGGKVVSEKMLEDSCGILLFETTSLKSGIYYICTIVGNEFIDCKNVAITR
jgi:hypothetical protein